VADELFDVLAATVDRLDLELVDVEIRSGLARVTVDRPGGVDLEAIAEATRAISEALDEHDPLPGHRYTLEVSSPGVERPLRTPAQFARAVGEEVSVRLVAGGAGERRIQGRLTDADDAGITVAGEGTDEAGRHIAYDEIERARTVFVWGASPRSSKGRQERPGGRSPAPRARGAGSGKVTAT